MAAVPENRALSYGVFKWSSYSSTYLPEWVVHRTAPPFYRSAGVCVREDFKRFCLCITVNSCCYGLLHYLRTELSDYAKANLGLHNGEVRTKAKVS